MSDAPHAARVWVEDRSWRVLAPDAPPRRCRFGVPCCGRPAVASLFRPYSRASRRAGVWWHYCELHLYGRRLEGVRVLADVHPESPAAEAGYVE